MLGACIDLGYYTKSTVRTRVRRHQVTDEDPYVIIKQTLPIFDIFTQVFSSVSLATHDMTYPGS
jgi:hypothetical protein